MLERYGPIYNAARSALSSVIPKEHRAQVRRRLYDAEDFLRFGISNLEYYGSRDMFQRVYFQLNESCNWNRCWYCPQQMLRRGGGMTREEVFESMVSQLSSLGRKGFRGTVGPSFYNEPTMLGTRLVKKMEYIREHLPLARIIVHTNGIALTENLCQALLNVRVDQILITIHPGVPTRNIDLVSKRFQNEIKNGRLLIRTLDGIKLWNRAGLLDIPKDRVLHMERCHMASSELTIDLGGNVIFCGNDYNRILVEGNIMREGIMAIWENPEFKSQREQARRGEYTLELCRKCMGLKTS